MRTLLAAVVTAVVVGSFGAISSAASAHVDHRACVTEGEFDRFPTYKASESDIETFFDTKGSRVIKEPRLKEKHYRFCGHPTGFVIVVYRLPKTGPWIYDKAVIIYRTSMPNGSITLL